LYKGALKAEQILNDLHEAMHLSTQEVAQLVREEFDIKERKGRGKGKGNITWYNFDKSLKIEADVQDIVKWDEAMMTEAKLLFDEYLDKNLTEDHALIKEMVMKAFSNNKGMIDSRQVFQLLKYEEKIKNEKYRKACKLMKQAQGIDKTKLYMRIWEKTEDGSYRNINLNFSSI
jgi:tRNA G10  N-methylase Trm11